MTKPNAIQKDVEDNEALPEQMTQIRSLVNSDGQLKIYLDHVARPSPGPDEVLVRVEAAPIHPSDLRLLFADADLRTLRRGSESGNAVLTAEIPKEVLAGHRGRWGLPVSVGNEAAGTVIEAGSSPAAQDLLGKRVAMGGGGMFAESRCIAAGECLTLPAGITSASGAACFVNPLTVLCMVERLRHDGQNALVHTAAASTLGQMLNQVCLAENIALVNIVRRPMQAELLRDQGAKYVCDSSSPEFFDNLSEALHATGATTVFDATGGGTLASEILQAMETSLLRSASHYDRYGTAVHKQAYLYGNLDLSPTVVQRNFGMAWGMAGWLASHEIKRMGRSRAAELRQRVVAEIDTTFVTHYHGTLSFDELLRPEVAQSVARLATSQKFLLQPGGA